MKKELYIWDMNNTQTHTMTSRRNFAIALSKGPVQVQSVSKKLDRIVALWISRNEIKLTNGAYELA
jgi:hypothetical protein